jgi:phosphatidylethanolamine/phosphatidyl-N-methylethanolamine N-methyltransferase
MKEHIHFLQNFIKNPLKVGSISPSSPDLALKMIAGIKADEDNVVLEIGCGTGAITKFLQSLIPTRKAYLGIEIEQDFVKKLNVEFSNLNIVCGNACNAARIVDEQDLGKVSYIISGLPFVVLPKEVEDEILREVDKFMKEGCLFRTFQYAHGYNLPPARKFRKKLTEKYGTMERSDIILKNVPPAYVLTWKT